MDEQYRKDLQFVKDKILSIYDSFFDDKLFLEIDSITFLSFRIDELKKQVKFLSSKNTIDTKQFIPIFILSEKIKLSFRKEDIHVDNRRIVISKLNIFENLSAFICVHQSFNLVFVKRYQLKCSHET